MPKKRFYKKPLFWAVLLFLAIAGIIYFFLFSKTVQIADIEISGNDKVATADIKNLAGQSAEIKILDLKIIRLATSSILLPRSKKTKQDILSAFPMIEDVEITKKLFRRGLFITIKERKPFAVFCQGIISVEEKCFVFDKNGIAFGENENAEQDFIVVRKSEGSDKLPFEISLGEKVIEKNIIDAISAVQKDLDVNFQIDIKEALVSDYLTIKTSENWEIYFNQNDDIQFQITKLNALLEKEISIEERKKIQYIYLQYKDRAYYK